MDIKQELFNNKDEKYREFHSRLVPTVNADKIIGVRVPILRRLARQAVKEKANVLTDYYEERMIKGFMIGYEKCPLEKHLSDLKDFIPLIDNWAVCDCVCSTLKFTEKNREQVWEFLLPYLNGSEYEVRFAVVMMIDYYLVDEYINRVLDCFLSIKRDEYYINMAVAWALSVAFVKYESLVMAIIENRKLDPWTHNKAIQKIRESNRVDRKTKDRLNLLKIKKIQCK